jgi:hypothetical protein
MTSKAPTRNPPMKRTNEMAAISSPNMACLLRSSGYFAAR